MKITLQFIHRRVIPWWGLICLLATTLMTLWFGQVWLNLRQQLEVSTESMARLQEKVRQQNRQFLMSQNQLTPAERQTQRLHSIVLQKLTYPWNRVFSDIEQVQENGVGLLSFSHDQSSEVTQLSVEGLDTPSIIRYVNKLNGGNLENHWYISSYQTQMQSAPVTVKATIQNK